MRYIEDLLKGGDRRSIGRANDLVALVTDQELFDELFEALYHPDRRVAMRAVDAIEKIAIKNSFFLHQHKKAILMLCNTAADIELKWHLALIVVRLDLTKQETGLVWQLLSDWAMDKKESKIVRVNALQGLYMLTQRHAGLIHDFKLTVDEVEREQVPSINARIRKLRRIGL